MSKALRSLTFAAAVVLLARPAAPASIDELLAACPTAGEVQQVDQDLQLFFFADPSRGAPPACTAAGGSADLTPFQKRVYQALLAMQRIPFDAPFPWTSRPLYDWFKTAVRGIQFRSDVPLTTCCGSDGLIKLKTAPTRAEDDSCLMSGDTPLWVEPGGVCGMDAFIALIVHEARHNEIGNHTCGSNDQTIDEMGAWAVQYFFDRWLAQHTGTYLSPIDGRPAGTYHSVALEAAHQTCSSRFCAQGCLDEGQGAISGTVTDADTGAGLPGVRVTVFSRPVAKEMASAVTNAAGQYTTNGILPTGTYSVMTLQPMGGTHADEMYDDVACVRFGCSVNLGTPVSVTVPANTSGIDFALARSGGFSGQVKDADTGAAVADMSVFVYDAAGRQMRALSTDGSGRYTADQLRPGTYFAKAARASSGYAGRLFDGIECEPSCTVTSGTPIVVAGGTTAAGIDFALHALSRPRVSIDDVRVTENAFGAAVAVFTVTLSNPVDVTVGVAFATADGTAAANIDYRPASGTLSIAPGRTRELVVVDIIGDVVHESDETFTVNLSAPVNAGIAKGQGIGTIVDDGTATIFNFNRALRARSLDVILSGLIRIDSFDSRKGPWGAPCTTCKGGVNIGTRGDVQTAGRLIRTPDVVIKGKILEHAPSTQDAIPLPAGAKPLGHYVLNGNQNVTLAAGNYVAETFTMNDYAQLTASGPVKIWVRQAVNLSGYAKVRVASGRSQDFWLIGLPGMPQANLNAAVRFSGGVYTPDAVINVAGSCHVFGGLAGLGLVVNGDSRLHFDEDMAGGVAP